MPNYDYLCKECGHRFEAFQSMKDDMLTTCPACARESLQRLIGAGAGLLFKGSGYYLTDYKKSSSSQASTASESSESAGNSSESAAASESATSSTPSAGTEKTTS
jgi:putative FmdB family regulatory protein